MEALRRGGALALLLLGCGDALVDDRYRGEPQWRLQGDVTFESLAEDTDVRGLRLALFWSPGGPTETDLERMVEQRSTGIAVPMVPSPFTLQLFEPPEAAQRVRGAPYGLARALAYLDRDGDGRRGPGEPFVGGDVPHAFLYAPRALAPGEAPTSGPVPAGVYTLLLPQRCGLSVSAPTTPGDCGVPIGEPCETAGMCGAGRGACIQRQGLPWINGVCAVADLITPPPLACRPGSASFIPAIPSPAGVMNSARGYYIRRCQRDADCLRPMDRLVNTYVCDVGHQACVPGGTHVSITGAAQVNPVCPAS